jgi:hypothetical protein
MLMFLAPKWKYKKITYICLQLLSTMPHIHDRQTFFSPHPPALSVFSGRMRE